VKEYSSGKVDPMSMFSGKETGKELDVQLVNAIKAAASKAGISVADFYKKHIAGTPGEPMLRRESAELEEYSSGKVDPMSMFSGKETGKELDIQLANAVKSAAKKVGMSVQDFMKKHILAQPGERSAPGETSWNESEELEEALATVAELRTQLQEVNLLNAKLLYVNKVFKANNLTESQKVNVVAAFDKAETVKEVKLVFETVSKNVVTKPVTIKEHKSFASKAAGTAATAGKKEIISEVSEQVARWQKLAGIIK
jgi:predicted transcriptional regulator